MNRIATFVFWVTLSLYIVTLTTVTYVGVYLTYAAVPLILVSGLIMIFTKPKANQTSAVGSALNEFGKATANAVHGLNDLLSEANGHMEKFNRTHELVLERTKTRQNAIRELRLRRVEPTVELKYAKAAEERAKHQMTIASINEQIRKLEVEISDIRKQCELEVASERS